MRKIIPHCVSNDLGFLKKKKKTEESMINWIECDSVIPFAVVLLLALANKIFVYLMVYGAVFCVVFESCHES